jgi:hypothetical protein
LIGVAVNLRAGAADDQQLAFAARQMDSIYCVSG